MLHAWPGSAHGAPLMLSFRRSHHTIHLFLHTIAACHPPASFPSPRSPSPSRPATDSRCRPLSRPAAPWPAPPALAARSARLVALPWSFARSSRCGGRQCLSACRGPPQCFPPHNRSPDHTKLSSATQEVQTEAAEPVAVEAAAPAAAAVEAAPAAAAAAAAAPFSILGATQELINGRAGEMKMVCGWVS